MILTTSDYMKTNKNKKIQPIPTEKVNFVKKNSCLSFVNCFY